MSGGHTGALDFTVSGKKRVGKSDREMHEALGSAIDQLVAALERALVAPHTALSTIESTTAERE